MTPSAAAVEHARRADDDPGFVTIGNREVYDLVAETRGDVQRVARLVDPLVPQVLDHEVRLRSLERKVWAVAGVATLALSGLVARLLAIATG